MKYKEYIPCAVKYRAEENPLWGRLLELSGESCELYSKYDFRKYKKLHLSFEFKNESFDILPVRVSGCSKDSDLYYRYRCFFLKNSETEKLSGLISQAR